MSDCIRWIYLAAVPNSGSTIAAVMANTHPELVSPGELKGPGGTFHGAEGPTCSCGKTVSECPFWCEVGERMTEKGLWWRPDYWGTLHHRGQKKAPLATRLLYGHPGPHAYRDKFLEHLPFSKRKIRGLQERNFHIGASVLSASGKQVLFDTSKAPEQIPRLVRLQGVDLRVIHFVRDPRGWCYSRKKKGFGSVDSTVGQWVSRNRYIGRMLKAVSPEKSMVVRYEDFCADPEDVMHRIYELGELQKAPVPDCVSPGKFHILGNRMRTLDTVGIKEDKSWERMLSKAEIDTVEKQTGSLAGQYGYAFCWS